MCVVAYISGHGFGHAARAVEILRRLPPDIPLVLKTPSPEWFWRAEMGGRPFEYVRDQWDVGCVQRDSLHIDVPATLAAYREIAARNDARREAELADLRQRGARLIVCDVAPYPITLAAELGIPGVLFVNFTWADIYEAFVTEEPAFAPIAAGLRDQYRLASRCLVTYPALSMPYLPNPQPVGLVCRPGGPRCDELLAALPPEASGKRLALVYLGAWGYPIPYPKAEAFADWHFLSLDPPPVPVANWSVVPRDLMGHPDLVASVDLVVSKPGYGIVGECFSQGTPLLFSPRPGFAEYPALEGALLSWPVGIRLSEEAFLALDWGDALDSIPVRGVTPKVAADGGEQAAAAIEGLYAGDEGGA